MNKKAQTGALILMLCLIIPSFAGAILGITNQNKPQEQTNENPEHLPYYNNKLWFYNIIGSSLGNYACESEKCKVAVPSSNDAQYDHISKDILDKEIPVIAEHMVFLQDSDIENPPIFLYDLKSGFAFKDNAYTSVKKYNSLDNIFIVENNNKKYGILKIGEYPQLVVPFESDYIGLLDSEEKYFVLNQDNKWVLMDSNFSKIGNPLEQRIIGASKDYIAVKDNDSNAFVINSEGIKVLPEDYQDVFLIDKYAGVQTYENEFMVYNLETTSQVGDTLELNNNAKISMKKENNELVIEINGNKESTIKIS